MEFISINYDNIENEHICCAIGNDKRNKLAAQSKKEWLKGRFDEGLVFKRLNERGKFFIEYMPIENVWKPLIGENYYVINCLWVSGQYKEKGIAKELFNLCIDDAKSTNKDGIAIVSSNKVKPFLTDKKFFIKHGCEVVDTAKPYFELLTLKLNSASPNPQFTLNAKEGHCHIKNGFAFIYSNQCPFMEEYVNLLASVCKKRNIPNKIIKINNYTEAQNIGSPFGTLGIYYNSKFLTHELMTEQKFEILLESVLTT